MESAQKDVIEGDTEIDLATPVVTTPIQSYQSLFVTILRFEVEFIVNFHMLFNSWNQVHANTNLLISWNESVNSPSL